MDLQHISIKLFANETADFELTSLIPVFHGWIQRKALGDLTTIDVADYSHVPNGPGVMLICHEGHFSVNTEEGRLGVSYANKRLATGSTGDRLNTAIQRVNDAAKLLEAEQSIDLSFSTTEVVVRFDDFLDVSNESFDSVKDDVREATSLLLGSDAVVDQVEASKAGLTIRATAGEPTTA